MTIRSVRAADREPLEQILRSDRTFRADEIAVACQLIDGSIAGDPDYVILVVESAARVAGYICFGPTPMTQATYDLYWIVVDADRRGHGLARLLVAAMETAIRARGGGQVRIETSPAVAHDAARAMYKKLGYPIACELPDFYAPGESVITYYKHLGTHAGDNSG